MRTIAQRILKSEGLIQSAQMVVGNNLATLISAVALIMISRLLGPSMFGEFSVGISIAMIWTRFVDLGISTALIKRASESTDQKRVNDLFSFTIKTKMITAVIMTLIGLFVVNQIMNLIEIGEEKIVYMGIILSLATVAYDQLIVMLQSLGRFSQAIVVNFFQASLKLASVAVFFFTNISNPFLIFLVFAGIPIVPTLFSKMFIPSWIKIDLSIQNKEVSKLIISLVKHTSIGIIALALIENVSIIFVRGFMDAYDAGLLAGVSRISTFLLLVAGSLGNVLFVRVAKYKTKQHILAYTKKATLFTFLILVSFITFIPFSKLMILYTIGPEYLSGNPILLILAGASFISIATVPLSALFYSFEKPTFFSVTGVIQAIIIIGGNWMFVPQYGLVASALATLTSRVVMFFMISIWGLSLVRQKFLSKKPIKNHLAP
ncbi:MAG: oligosaccharide flippase family protein [Patescibacteria group bacterium]